MLCVNIHIREDVFDNSNRNHRNHVNNFIKMLHSVLSYDELHDDLDNFWRENTYFNNNNDSFIVMN